MYHSYALSTMNAGAHHAYFLWYSLAWCELYLFFGYLFRKVEMELHDTTYVHLEVGADKGFEFPLCSIEDMAYRCHLTPTFRGRMLHCMVKARGD